MASHKMYMAKVSWKYAREHGLNQNHHARVWCSCMDNPDRPPGFYSDRPLEQVLNDPRRLGAFDHIGVVDLRESGAAVAMWREHVKKMEGQ